MTRLQTDEQCQQCLDRQRASGRDATQYQQVIYEGYAPHGVALLVETATDNPTRTVAGVRNLLTKGGGNLATSGSVSFLFRQMGTFNTAKMQDLRNLNSDGPTVEELTDRLRRAQVDLDNQRKRGIRLREEERVFERDRVIARWLPVVDNLDLAIGYADADPATLLAGVRGVDDVVDLEDLSGVERLGVLLRGSGQLAHAPLAFALI